jgi:hypothetical protein
MNGEVLTFGRLTFDSYDSFRKLLLGIRANLETQPGDARRAIDYTDCTFNTLKLKDEDIAALFALGKGIRGFLEAHPQYIPNLWIDNCTIHGNHMFESLILSLFPLHELHIHHPNFITSGESIQRGKLSVPLPITVSLFEFGGEPSAHVARIIRYLDFNKYETGKSFSVNLVDGLDPKQEFSNGVYKQKLDLLLTVLKECNKRVFRTKEPFNTIPLGATPGTPPAFTISNEFNDVSISVYCKRIFDGLKTTGAELQAMRDLVPPFETQYSHRRLIALDWEDSSSEIFMEIVESVVGLEPCIDRIVLGKGFHNVPEHVVIHAIRHCYYANKPIEFVKVLEQPEEKLFKRIQFIQTATYWALFGQNTVIDRNDPKNQRENLGNDSKAAIMGELEILKEQNHASLSGTEQDIDADKWLKAVILQDNLFYKKETLYRPSVKGIVMKRKQPTEDQQNVAALFGAFVKQEF